MHEDTAGLLRGKDPQTELTKYHSNLFNVHERNIEETKRTATARQDDWLDARELEEAVDISPETVSDWTVVFSRAWLTQTTWRS